MGVRDGNQLDSGAPTMTWFSRLTQKDRRASQRASRRRRSMISLERLETRTVLSNVSVLFPAPGTASQLLIVGSNNQNDYFTIRENTDGSVTVLPGGGSPMIIKPGVGIIAPSTLNGNAAQFDTNNP